jgi:hypothetical protein
MTDRSIELLERRGASTSGCEVIDHNDGTYTCNAVVLATGRYTLHVCMQVLTTTPRLIPHRYSPPAATLSTSSSTSGPQRALGPSQCARACQMRPRRSSRCDGP